MSMNVTFNPNASGWNLDFSSASEKPSKIEEQIKEAAVNLNAIFSAASTDLTERVHPLKTDATYDKVYAVYKQIKKIGESLGKEQVQEKKCLETLSRSILSLKIGGAITPEILEQNPDFEQFVKANFWHNKSYHYNHVLPLIDGQPGVIFEGKPMKFSEFCALKNEHDELLVDEKTRKLNGCCIIKQGIMPWSSHNVKEIFAHTTEDPSAWGNQYIYEIVTSLLDEEEKTPHFTGDHCWLRLRTKDGEVYSWGVVRPSIDVWQGLAQRSKMMLNGVPECPDQFETLEKKEHHVLATQIPITEEQFEEIRGNLNTMNQKGVPFSVLTGLTCQGHVVHQAEKIGVKIESEMTAASFIGRSFFGKTVNWLWKVIVPKFIRVIFRYIADFFLGIFVGRFAAIHAQDPKVKEAYGTEYDRFLHGFFDIFHPVQVQHPLAMRKWQRKVEKFRNSDAGKALGPYALPQKFLIEKIEQPNTAN